MRLFAAVYPPPSEVAAVVTALGDADDRLRYVPSEQWHLTVAFYGDVADAVVPALTERLGRAAARSTAMSLRLRGGGTFPKQAARARVLWAGLAGDVEELARLADRCGAAGRRVGVPMEDRPYRPHLTLARARKDPLDLRDAVATLSTHEGRPWTVTSVGLVQSTLGAQVHHETLHEFPLSS